MFGDLSYAEKDIASIREEVMNYIREHDPNWTDYNESSLQLQYVDIVSGVVDLMCYYLDNQALETYLATARQEKNVKNILSTINYYIDPMGTAQGMIRVSRSLQEVGVTGEFESYLHGRISIPKYTVVYNDDTTVPKYLTADEAFMTNEMHSVDIPVIQGELRHVSISNEILRDSYKLYVTDKPVPLDYVEIVNDEEDPEPWVKVEDAFLEIDGGKKYSVHVDSKDRVYIMFTYNWRNYVSKDIYGGITIRYVESVGSSGKVVAGSLRKLGSGAIDVDTGEDLSVALDVINDKPTYGAFDKPSINEQKANARNWLQTYDRLITLQDFETLLKKETWIKDCYVADWRTNGTLVRYPHEAKAWVVTTDGADVSSDEVFAALQKEIQDKTVMMTSVEIKSAEFYTQEWKVGIEVTGASEEKKLEIRSRVEDRLKNRYLLTEYCKGNEETKLKFNMEVRKSLLEAEILNMSDCIVDVKLPIEENFQLRENEFLNITNIEVYLI